MYKDAAKTPCLQVIFSQVHCCTSAKKLPHLEYQSRRNNFFQLNVDDDGFHLDEVHEDFHLDEVHEDVSEALHVVSPALLDAEVGVDRRVSSCARQVLVFSEQIEV